MIVLLSEISKCLNKKLQIDTVSESLTMIGLEVESINEVSLSSLDSNIVVGNIKKIVKQKLQEGKSEKDIKKFLVERYGEYILFRPLMNYNNIFLWSFPFILLIIGLFFVLIKSKGKKV